MNHSLFSSDSDHWATPVEFFAPLHRELRFSVDACAEKWSAKIRRFWDPKTNGLVQSWAGERVWLNPPYSQVGEWMRRARHAVEVEGALVCCLVPARTDTVWWNGYVAGRAGALLDSRYDALTNVWWVDWEGLSVAHHFVPGRLQFETAAPKRKTTSAPFPSAIVLFVPTGMARPRVADPWLTRLWLDGDAVRALAQAARPGRLQLRGATPIAPASFSPAGRGGHFPTQHQLGRTTNG